MRFFSWIVLLFLVSLGFSADWKLEDPNGKSSLAVYQKADQEHATLLVRYSKPSLQFNCNMTCGEAEFKANLSSYFILLPANQKQRVKVSGPLGNLELAVPAISARTAWEYTIVEVSGKPIGKGNLTLQSIPSGVDFTVDGFDIQGVTPYQRELNALEYSFLFRKDRYKPKQVSIAVQKDQMTSKIVEMEPAWADISFTAERADTYVEFLGRRFLVQPGEPLTFSGESNGLLEDRYTYRFGAPGAKEREDSFVAEAGQKRTLKLNVPIEWGVVIVNSNPTGALVIWDGKEVGFTPFTMENIPVGSHKLQLKSADGKMTEQVVEVKSLWNTF